MSSPNFNSTNPPASGTERGPSPRSLLVAALALALLGALVWGLAPSRPGLTPAPVRPLPAGCLKGSPDFTPTNITEIPNLQLDGLEQQRKNQALLRLNMEPCSCGCMLSLASCRLSNSVCETSRNACEKIITEEKGEQGGKR